MKISEVVSFARNQMSSMPEVSWRGRTMAIWGAVAGVCLLYIFRVRLSQLLFKKADFGSIPYRSFEKELISFQQFVEIHAHQFSEWLLVDESSPEWGSEACIL